MYVAGLYGKLCRDTSWHAHCQEIAMMRAHTAGH